MTAILVFLTLIVVSLLDPLRWIGWIAAGLYIKDPILCAVAGILWALILQVILVGPISSATAIRIVVASIIATLIVWAITKKRRESKASRQPQKQI